MKALIKYYLVWGFALSFLAVIARRVLEDPEIEAVIDPSGHAPQPPRPAGLPAPSGNGAFTRRAADPTVTFNGTVIRNGSRFALRETAGALYLLDSAGRAWSFEGENVRVTGQIDMGTRLLHVEAIEPATV